MKNSKPELNIFTPLVLIVPPRTLAEICKAAADPLRLDVLRVLSRDSFGVQELASIFSVPQPGMSHHLKILFKSGLVVTRRQGNSIFYRRALLKDESELNAFQRSLYVTIDSSVIGERLSKQINLVYKDRATQSQIYFERNADKFEENQGLLCELNQYLPALKELLDLMEIPKKSRALEVGPGQGFLLEELGQYFESMVALDNSDTMLELTREKLGRKNKRIQFVNSALGNYSPASEKFDAVILNMVMHHMPSPARAFQNLAQLVRVAGYVLIADLCSHNQDWVRDCCGDLWLGFDPQDLNDWAKGAGFKEKQSLYLGQKNGFQIQIKLFEKL